MYSFTILTSFLCLNLPFYASKVQTLQPQVDQIVDLDPLLPKSAQ